MVSVPLPPVVLNVLSSHPATGEYIFWSGNGLIKSSVADWQRSLRKLFELAGIKNGHAHRFRDTFSVALLQSGVTMEHVAILLGNSIKIVEKHYSPWVESRQLKLEEAVRGTWTSA